MLMTDKMIAQVTYIAPGETIIIGEGTIIPNSILHPNYPGREQAEALGYTFRRLLSNQERAIYTKGIIDLLTIDLLIRYVNDCELEFILSTQLCEAHIYIGPLPFPHSRFRMFEQRLQDILEKCRDLFPAYLEK